MLVAANNGVDKLSSFVVINRSNFGDKLSSDSSIGKRHLIFGFFKFRRVVVAVDDVDDDQGRARKLTRNSAICRDDCHQMSLLTFSVETPLQNEFSGNGVDLEDVGSVVFVAKDRERDVAVRTGAVAVGGSQLQDDRAEGNGFGDRDVVRVVSELRAAVVDVFDVEENDRLRESASHAIRCSYSQLKND